MILKISKSIEFEIGRKHTIGSLYFGIHSPKAERWFYGVHIGPKIKLSFKGRWGYQEDWYDGPLYSFGVGPFLHFVWAKE